MVCLSEPHNIKGGVVLRINFTLWVAETLFSLPASREQSLALQYKQSPVNTGYNQDRTHLVTNFKRKAVTDCESWSTSYKAVFFQPNCAVNVSLQKKTKGLRDLDLHLNL